MFDAEDVALWRLELQDALNSLSADEQSVLLLREKDGLSDTEIAAQMGRSENAVRLLRFRANRKLGEWRRKLGQQ